MGSEEDMLPEYHFDYRKARPNRFAADIAEGSLVVVLEPELAQVQDFRKSDNRSAGDRECVAAARAGTGERLISATHQRSK